MRYQMFFDLCADVCAVFLKPPEVHIGVDFRRSQSDESLKPQGFEIKKEVHP